MEPKGSPDQVWHSLPADTRQQVMAELPPEIWVHILSYLSARQNDELSRYEPGSTLHLAPAGKVRDDIRTGGWENRRWDGLPGPAHTRWYIRYTYGQLDTSGDGRKHISGLTTNLGETQAGVDGDGRYYISIRTSQREVVRVYGDGSVLAVAPIARWLSGTMGVPHVGTLG
ncbi:MAG TPA: F-box protein [Mycobacteriales bacterium]|nr:F-box protein [Mycobacteriales bacterium]